MKTAVYLRVSSKSQTTAAQEPDLKRWARGEEAAGCRLDWFRDTFTGKTLDRPGWSELWLGVVRGDYRRVVVWRLDRLGRTAREVTPLLAELQARNVALISLREGFDLSTPGGMLFANMLASFAQYETEVRGERQTAGIAAAKSRGVYLGRRKGSLKADPARAAELRAKGLTVAEITAAMGVSDRTAARYLAQGSPA